MKQLNERKESEFKSIFVKSKKDGNDGKENSTDVCINNFMFLIFLETLIIYDILFLFLKLNVVLGNRKCKY